MLNIIKADLYRIFKGKGIYITLTLFFALVIFQVAAGSMGKIGVNIDTSQRLEFLKLTGETAAFATMSGVDNYLYFMLALIIFIAATDFSSGAIKNVLSNGTSRIQLYFSKLILSFIFAFILLLLNVILSIITATIINGFGGSFNVEFVLNITKAFLPQLFLVFAVVSVGIFLVFATKKTAIVIGSYIGFCMIPMILILTLFLLTPDALKILDYELIGNMRQFGNIAEITTDETIRAYILATVYIIASTAAGLMIFKRSEIK